MTTTERTFPAREVAAKCRHVPEWNCAIGYAPQFRDVVILNAFSYAVWLSCNGKKDVEAIADQLHSGLNSPLGGRARVLRDVIEAVSRLAQAQLIALSDLSVVDET